MTEGESLLASVIADADDDTARLVYADWLEEYGGDAGAARAEFIRVQVEKEPSSEGDPRRALLEAREKELLEGYAEEWLRPLPEWATPPEWNLVAAEEDDFGFHRGFLRGVVVPSVDRFLADAPSVFSAEPITHLFLTEADALPELGRSREFLGVRWLWLCRSAAHPDDGPILLSRLPIMPRLRFLRLRRCGMGDRELKDLAKWPGLATVEELELTHNRFNSPGMKALIASPYLTRMRRLDLTDSTISTKTRQTLRERFGEAVEL